MLLIVCDYGNNNNNELFYFIIIFYLGGVGSIVFTSKRKGACRNHYE